MQQIGRARQQIAIFNAYLPEAIEESVSGRLMHANAHPSSTDFFAACRMEGKNVQWLSSLAELQAYRSAWQAVSRLRAARFLKVGETEPWVINSCRDPEVIARKVGCEVIPVEREALYEGFHAVSDSDAEAEAQLWSSRTKGLQGIGQEDVLKACKVTVAMRRALESHQADGLSMACFAMIGDLDTTSCLALSALNDSANAIGACEGDLDAALTLFLLKALGADFVWIANPIIHSDNCIDLAHCTAPTCACGASLKYSLMRHHESGRGVSPEVELPSDRIASAVRLSVLHEAIACHVGLTERKDKLPACHTQVRLHVESSRAVLDSLLGTHLVLSYEDHALAIRYAADFLGFTSFLSRKSSL
jgi:L-fucose isomerase-like protein